MIKDPKDPKNIEYLKLVWKIYMGGDYQIYNRARTRYTASYSKMFYMFAHRSRSVGHRICIEVEKDDKRSKKT